jgi:cytochrome c peroxidase
MNTETERLRQQQAPAGQSNPTLPASNVRVPFVTKRDGNRDSRAKCQTADTNLMRRTTARLLPVTLILVAALNSLTATGAIGQTRDDHDGEFLFDKETFGGNGRTCEVCHSKKTGTFSIQDAQARFAKNPNDPLFRAPDSDNLDGKSYDRLLTTGTIKIDVPLAPNVSLVDNPSARTVTMFRAVPSVQNVTTLVEFLMADGRETSANLQHQALGAVHQHTQNTIEPTQKQLDAIALFERTDERFFSSERLMRFARGGPPPQLPVGRTAAEKRGRIFFQPNRQCGICHSGPMLNTASDFNFLNGPGSHFENAGAGARLGHLNEAFDANGVAILEPTNPNPNRAYRFELPDGSSTVIVASDLGRALITGDLNDTFNVRIPTLWGVKDTAPYFHDNSARTLEDVMDHYNRLFLFLNDLIPNDVFQPLTDQDKADIVAFLKLL